jgi:2-oxoglutarate ferredoxin oxidoreductase subunit alpha
LPGTHATKGSYFTRGTTRDPYARYSERGPDYVYNVERLQRKFATAANLVPQPEQRPAARKTSLGVLYFGSTSPAMDEALEVLAQVDIHIDAMRLRAYPFPASVAQFVADHEQVFVVEQNRDAQMRSLLINEFDIDPARLTKVLHFDGTPITGRFIVGAISQHLEKRLDTSGKPAARTSETSA